VRFFETVFGGLGLGLGTLVLTTRLLLTIFTAYIVFVFLACFYNGCACDRFSAWSCSLRRARQRVSGVSYIPFIHSRHNAKDRKESGSGS